MDANTGSAREGELLAKLSRWRRLAVAIAALLVLSTVTFGALALRRSPPAPDPGAAEAQSQKLAEAVRKVSHSRAVSVEVAQLHANLADVRNVLTRYLISLERADLEPLPHAVKGAREQIERVRELVTNPEQRRLLETVDKEFTAFVVEVEQLTGEPGKARGPYYSRTLKLLDHYDKAQAAAALADDAEKRLEISVAELETIVR